MYLEKEDIETLSLDNSDKDNLLKHLEGILELLISLSSEPYKAFTGKVLLNHTEPVRKVTNVISETSNYLSLEQITELSQPIELVLEGYSTIQNTHRNHKSQVYGYIPSKDSLTHLILDIELELLRKEVLCFLLKICSIYENNNLDSTSRLTIFDRTKLEGALDENGDSLDELNKTLMDFGYQQFNHAKKDLLSKNESNVKKLEDVFAARVTQNSKVLIADLERKSEQTQNKLNAIESNLSNVQDSLIKSFDDRVNTLIVEKNNQIREEAKAFESLNKELSKQLSITGSQTLANQNTAQANKEKNVADLLRIIGTTWLIGLSIYAAVVFGDLINKATPGELHLEVMLIRWLIIFLLTLPGIYLLKESARHRADERRYRQLGVQLSTINSYLEGFNDDDKLKVKQELTTNFFSSSEVKADDSSVPDMLKSFEKTLDAVINIAKRK
ncbi:hypothetical protein NOL51_15785 [Vibrio parahaemolyticus]|uniref:hypothetical protein n=1 Tax=Vibrio parahaemolyticus TaxID=670 RepID=UPI00226AB460|nr:hypothetical protein [Vibrio parahaemolyticus]MCX8934523.1 hypothetical protein [Vibrio parahaemolyticus]